MAIVVVAANALPEKLPLVRAERRGRQGQRAGKEYDEAPESPDKLYAAPEDKGADTGYGAPPAEEAPAEYGVPAAKDDASALGTSYGAPDGESSGEKQADYYDDYGTDQASYNNDQDAQPSDDNEVTDDAAGEAADPLAMLMKSVPGIPGEDYPIFAEAPETGFSCEGQVNGGKFDTLYDNLIIQKTRDINRLLLKFTFIYVSVTILHT